MLSNFGIVGGLSIALAIAGMFLTAYGIVAKDRPNGLSIAIVGLPVLGVGLGLMSIALLTPMPY
ncbi:MAG TPA: hypothetical protein VIM56_15905 [Rhizomicrobium sp.]